jgi:hypothetical protein
MSNFIIQKCFFYNLTEITADRSRTGLEGVGFDIVENGIKHHKPPLEIKYSQTCPCGHLY